MLPWHKPIPALVKLPVSPTPKAEQCDFLDLTSFANTDPFTAPFGVPMPKGARLLFTGMPVGVQAACGVPFRVIDPAQNKGRVSGTRFQTVQ